MSLNLEERAELGEMREWFRIHGLPIAASDTLHPVVDCVEWDGPLRNKYGKIGTLSTHRVAYSMFWGESLESIEGLLVLHSCDNPPCVNPFHLRTGTNRENVQDSIDRGRWTSGERHGCHRLTWDQVREIRRRHRPGVNRWDRGNTRELEAEFEISRSQLNYIVNNKNWREQ